MTSSRRPELLLLAGVAGFACLLSARSAAAATNPTMCLNDIDCVATPQCGGDVCDYNTTPPTCKPAGSQPKGADGWCTANTDCKCMGQGATCAGLFCTFTRPCDAPDAGPCAAGGSGGGGGGGGGTSGGSSGGGGGGGGCNVAGSDARLGWAALLGVAGLAGLTLSRRRRR